MWARLQRECANLGLKSAPWSPRLMARTLARRQGSEPMPSQAMCIIQARSGSTRLPGKVLAPLSGRPMLRYMLDRLAPLTEVDVVVATSLLQQDDPVAQLASAAGVSVVRGSEEDVLDRFRIALD